MFNKRTVIKINLFCSDNFVDGDSLKDHINYAFICATVVLITQFINSCVLFRIVLSYLKYNLNSPNVLQLQTHLNSCENSLTQHCMQL